MDSILLSKKWSQEMNLVYLLYKPSWKTYVFQSLIQNYENTRHFLQSSKPLLVGHQRTLCYESIAKFMSFYLLCSAMASTHLLAKSLKSSSQVWYLQGARLGNNRAPKGWNENLFSLCNFGYCYWRALIDQESIETWCRDCSSSKFWERCLHIAREWVVFVHWE